MTAPNELRRARVRVPASTSNLGSGFDCIGLALDRHLTAGYEPADGPLRLTLEGTLAGLVSEPEDDLLARAFRARLARHGIREPGGRLRVRSAIPVARGLGSSAAAVVAGLTLADAVRGAGAPDGAEALEAAAAEEGHPDNAAPALLGGLVAVARAPDGAARVVPLPLSDAVGLAFAAPGSPVSTLEARAALPDAVPHEVATGGLGRLAALLRGLATADPELIRLGFVDELHVPYRLPLIPAAGAAIAAALEAGAWAATISGSGSGLIAACPPDASGAVAGAMADAFRSGPAADRTAADSENAGVIAFAAKPDRTGARLERPEAPWA